MKKGPTLAAIAILMIVVASPALDRAFFRDPKQDGYRATIALHDLYKGPKTPATGLDAAFKVLLKDPLGPGTLKTFSRTHPTVAYHEGLNAVFYLHADGPLDSALSCSAETPRGGWLTGISFQSSPTLTGLRLDGDLLTIEFEVNAGFNRLLSSPDEKYVPGQTYLARMNAAEFLDPQKRASDWIESFYARMSRK